MLHLKTDGATEASYARDVPYPRELRGGSPLLALNEALHWFARDTKRPRSDIIGYEAEIVESEVIKI